jgi:hypothetical protein
MRAEDPVMSARKVFGQQDEKKRINIYAFGDNGATHATGTRFATGRGIVNSEGCKRRMSRNKEEET